MSDLTVLVADKDMEFTLRGIFSRPEALGVRRFSYEIFRHIEHDPGCRTNSPAVLSGLSPTEKLLIMLDFEGAGGDSVSVRAIEEEIRGDISRTIWRDAGVEVIVIVPELEAWIWSGSPHLPTLLGWKDSFESVQQWLGNRGFLFHESTGKPARPKEALETVLRRTRKPRSSSLYERLSSTVSLARCQDPAFIKLRTTLRSWFPLE